MLALGEPSASERDSHRDSGSDAAKYPATSRSGKGKSSGGNPHGHRPNISARQE